MRFRFGAALTGLVGALLLGQGFAQAPEAGAGDVTLRVVKYDGLAREVLKHRGKVVVIDLWQFT
jgi:hypothetical protein